MPFVNSNGCRIHYRLEGSPAKPLLVLVHSLGSDHGLWDLQMAPFTCFFQILRLDLRGHGASDSTVGDYTIQLLAHDVLAAIDLTGRNQFAFCGLSLGGMIGQWLAANVGERITHLVLANTSPRMSHPALFDVRRKTVLESGMAAIADSAMPRSFTAHTLASSNPVVDSIRAILVSLDPVGYAGCCAAVRDMDHMSLLRTIKAPVLVIAGTEDISTPWVGHGEVLAKEIAGARSIILPTAHLSNLEQPSSFTSAVLEFLLLATDAAR